jgi:hypothetical protein
LLLVKLKSLFGAFVLLQKFLYTLVETGNIKAVFVLFHVVNKASQDFGMPLYCLCVFTVSPAAQFIATKERLVRPSRLLTTVERGAIVRLYRGEDRLRTHLKLK